MNNVKRWLLLVFLALCLGVSACGSPEHIPQETDSITPEPGSDTPSPVTMPEIPASDPVSTGSVPVDDTLPPREGMVRSRLTNEWVEPSVAATRPIAVIIPNEIAAVPHYNLSEASILYEANTEGRTTRLMAIYEDWERLDKIGNIRSLRSYFAYWSFEWDAFIVHFGGPFFINDLVAEPNTQHIDGNLSPGSPDSAAFFRSTDRDKPHNAYATGEGLAEAIYQKEYPLTYRGLCDENHYRFTPKANPNTLAQYDKDAKNATYIDMSGCYPLTRCYFEYNESDGLYYRSQHLAGGSDGPHIDAATGKQLAFKNILVQTVKWEDLGLDQGYMVFQCHDTTRDGWFFTNGKGIHVNWEKTTDYGATRYYDDNGNEIILNTGKTMVCVIQEGNNFTFR